MVKSESILNRIINRSIPILVLTMIFCSITAMLILSRTEAEESEDKNSEIAEVFLESPMCELIGLENAQNDCLAGDVAEIYIKCGGEINLFDYFFEGAAWVND